MIAFGKSIIFLYTFEFKEKYFIFVFGNLSFNGLYEYILIYFDIFWTLFEGVVSGFGFLVFIVGLVFFFVSF